MLTPVPFTPSAINLTGPGFSLIEMVNAPALGSWAPNPDTRDLRLAYFRKAPGLTLALNGVPEPVSPGAVRFIDTSLGGSFDAPEGFHALQINIDRRSLDVSEAALGSLLRLPDLAKHPIVGTFVIPALLSWKRPGIDREASGTADILRSVMATLVGSLLETPVDDEAQKPALSRAVKKYLDASYDNPDLDVATVAERFNLSRRSLFYFFENEELRLGERIRALRTRRALELLLQADAQKINLLRNCGIVRIHQRAKHAPCGERVYRDECEGDPSIRDRRSCRAATTAGVTEPLTPDRAGSNSQHPQPLVRRAFDVSARSCPTLRFRARAGQSAGLAAGMFHVWSCSGALLSARPGAFPACSGWRVDGAKKLLP